MSAAEAPAVARAWRNNSPGDLGARADGAWPGQCGVDAEGFARFVTRAEGWRALAASLLDACGAHTLAVSLECWCGQHHGAPRPAVIDAVAQAGLPLDRVVDLGPREVLMRSVARGLDPLLPWPAAEIASGAVLARIGRAPAVAA